MILSGLLFLTASLSHFYLSLRSYSLKGDKAIGKTICHIGENWNCDHALTSSFSNFFGIPISNFGLAFNLVCLLLLLLLRWNWLDSSKIWSDWLWRISLFLALSSVVMLSISLVYLKSFCPICVLCYLCSFAILWPLKKSLPSSRILAISKLSLTPFLWIAGAVLTFALLHHAFYFESHNISKLQATSHSSFTDWKEDDASEILSKTHSFLFSGTSSKKEATLTVVEFADFLCPYCKKAYKVLKNFQKAHPMVRTEYMHFPLDSTGCVPTENIVKDSISCFLPKAVFCANKQNFGHSLQNFIYDHQESFAQHRDLETIQSQLETFLNKHGIQISLFEKCVMSQEATHTIHNQIQVAKKLNITGTPVLFVNGKKIMPVAIQLTLEKILKHQQQISRTPQSTLYMDTY